MIFDIKSVFLDTVEQIKIDSLLEELLEFKNDPDPLLRLKGNGKEYSLKSGCKIIGFGKAILGMASYLINRIPQSIRCGVLSIPEGASEAGPSKRIVEACRGVHIKVCEGAKNNMPDENSFEACKTILKCIDQSTEDDLILVLISGGGSALLPHPVPGLSLEEKQDIIGKLSLGGADICELNFVRRQLSLVKGGGLAKYLYPAQVVVLILSDVIGDPLELIASGPTVPMTELKARSVLTKYGLLSDLPVPVQLSLEKKTVDEKHFQNIENILVGNNALVLTRANSLCSKLGCVIVKLSSRISGESSFVGGIFAQIVESIVGGNVNERLDLFKALDYTGNPILLNEAQEAFVKGKPIALLGGGETTVKVKGSGKGGRNQEMVLAFSVIASKFLLDSSLELKFLSCGTDGIDGPTDAAGAVVERGIWERVESMNIDPNTYLSKNDSYSFWNQIGGLVKTGHTGSNLMDLQILFMKRRS